MTMVGIENMPARRLYLRLSLDHRVSRSFRATWFIRNLMGCIDPQQDSAPLDGELAEDLSVLSLLGGNQLTPSTEVFYFVRRYSLVFVIDMTTSMFSVSNTTFRVKVEEAISSLCACLKLLAKPFQVSGSSVKLEPHLCITVLAYRGSNAREPIHVLLQGVHLSDDNCQEVTDILREKFWSYENSIAKGSSQPRVERFPRNDMSTSGDNGLEGMVKAGTLGLQLLPRTALKGLILLTDGIAGFPTQSAMHNAVNSMRIANFSCWVVQVGGAPDPSAAFGLMPDTETLNFMAQACNGCVIQPQRVLDVLGTVEKGESVEPNAVQQAFLFWTFQKSARLERVRELVGEGCEPVEDYFTPITYHEFKRSTTSAPLLGVVGCRIREGFFLKDILVKDSSIEVYLYYPWQPSVTIYCTITAPWPVTDSITVLHVVASYDGPYSFVRDIRSEQMSSGYRNAAVRKFTQALKTSAHSDGILAHLLRFTATPNHYTLSQNIQEGMPLFYLPPNQTKPVPSVGLATSGEKKSKESPLISFWRPLCTIDTNLWHRWFHSDKIVLILEPDLYPPRKLLVPSPGGRYATLQCRIAASKLFAFLKSWSTLILLENHLFVRFLPSKDTPKYFCLVRVAQKQVCVILHIAHVEGTPHSLQSQMVQSLDCSLRDLSVSGSERPLGAGHKRKSMVAQRLKPCTTVISKQLQRVMIRCDNVAGTPTPEPERLVQMDYLICSSWQWHVPHRDPAILTAILRHRLKEGFHLTGAHNGVITLAAQLTLEQPQCSSQLPMLLQYVVHRFPVGGLEETLKTELWIEPQHGIVCEAPPGLYHLKGVQHSDISEKIHTADQDLVTTIASFHYLQEKKQHSTLPPVLWEEKERTVSDGVAIDCFVPFDLFSLLPQSRVLGFTLAAFSETTDDKTSLDFNSCSPLNRHFRQQLIEELQHSAMTEVPLKSSQPLLERLYTSQFLKDLCSICHIDQDSGEMGWRCFALSQDENIYIFFVPTYFSRYPNGGGEGVESPFVLPVILLHCGQQILMEPDLTPQPDLYHHLPLSTDRILPSPQKGVSPILDQNLSQQVANLRKMHFSAYLHTVHSALNQATHIVPRDFLAGLAICEQTVLSVDFSPLIAALCRHTSANVHEEDKLGNETSPLSTEMLCHLLETLSAKIPSACWLSPRSEEDDPSSRCKKWKGEIEQSFLGYLGKLGLVGVPNCEGYYWLKDTSSQQNVEKYQREVSDLGSLEEEEEENGLSSPVSEPSTLMHKPSFSIDDDASQMTDVGTSKISPEATPSSEDDVMEITTLFSPTDKEDLHVGTSPTAPLFLQVRCTVKKLGGRSEVVSMSGLPVCFKSVVTDPPSDDSSYSVWMDFVFLSFSPEGGLLTHETPPSSSHESSLALLDVPSTLPTTYLNTALTLKHDVEWLLLDELISVAREATPISPALLQAVATHVQTSHQVTSCFSLSVPVKFVFGPDHSMFYFITQMEAIQVPPFSIVKTDEYYYLTPKPRPPSPTHTHDHTPEYSLHLMEFPPSKPHSPVGERSKTPPPPPLQLARKLGHRRSTSCGYPSDHAPQMGTNSNKFASYDSIEDVESLDVGSGYEASRSCSMSSFSGVLPGFDRQEERTPFWLVLRVLPHKVEIYFQLRSSLPGVETLLTRFQSLCDLVMGAVGNTCHQTNQWFLLKDLLETHTCSPFLLAESPSEAWVDEIVQKQVAHSLEFRPQQFQCNLQWRKHITPHWRLKAMKMQASLRITRTALSAFAVINRTDVYVLQDVRENGEETIFYLKIDESLCRVEDDVTRNLEESIVTTCTDGRETRATADVDSLSSYSFRQSLSEIPTEVERQVSLDLSQQVGRPQESLVLQLYGITKPSINLQERLNYIIQQKLDDTALEIMCSLYARNQRLKLTPADVQFLQPHHNEPSHILTISIPDWIEETQAFNFYFLQSLSAVALKPKYTSLADIREHLQVPLELQNAYLTAELQVESQQDHLFLYIRPHIQGRGMAVICVVLADQDGHVVAPQVGIVEPSPDSWDPNTSLEETLEECQFTEISEPHALTMTGSYSLRLYIWEKGNVGLSDLTRKLTSTFKHAVYDYLLELCLLPLPVASPMYIPEENYLSPRSASSPFVIIDTPTLSPWKSPAPKYLTEAPFRKAETSRRRIFEWTLSSVAGDEACHEAPVRSRSNTATIMEDIDDALRSIDTQHYESEGSESPEVLAWHHKEKLRREHEAKETVMKEACCGNSGILEPVYYTSIPCHLERAHTLGSPTVTQLSFSILGSYSAQTFLSQAMAQIQERCPDITLNTFKRVPEESPLYIHYVPDKDLTRVSQGVPELANLRYVVIGRNLQQWEECCNPTLPEFRATPMSLDPQTKQPLQLFQSLQSKKVVRNVEPPLQLSAIGKNVFIPRQRLVVMTIDSEQAQLWLYNMAEELTKILRNKLTALMEWQQLRVGFLHHMLAQKMGLFQHTHGRDLQNYTKVVAKQCDKIQDISALVKNTMNEATPTHSSSPRHSVAGPVNMEAFYLETAPHGPAQHKADPVYNHGQQFKDTYVYRRRQIEARDLMGKVFTSWQNQKGESSGAPVSSSAITSLKRTARLLHYCTSTLLLPRSLSLPSEAQGSSTQDTWFDSIREEFLSLYLEYLKSLSFQPINERPSSMPGRHKGSRTPSRSHHPIPHLPQKLYKCLQRSWPGGIMLIELQFQESVFFVKLFTLESSRLNQQTANSEVHGVFANECARYKDFIHIHSFMHDFHLHFILSVLNGTRQLTPDLFDSRKFLNVFSKCNKIPPNFIRNRLCKGSISVPISVNPLDLYHHIVAHSGVFGIQTVEAKPMSTSSTPNPEDICLLINVSPKSLGPTTTPQLSKLLQDTQENYSIRIIAVYKPRLLKDKYLKLVFYLLLVNKYDQYPRLTCDSPHLSSSKHPEPPLAPLGSPIKEYDESDLNFNVRKRRRKLGFGSLATPSAASQVVINMSVIDDRMKGIQVHLKALVKEAESHMRRDELWKRMLYGRQKGDTRPSSVNFEPLSCAEFRELLRLVSVCPFDSLDPHLKPLMKQTKKWYRRLIGPITSQFSDSIRLYSSEDDCYRFAAIINPEWQDMFVLVQSDRDGRHQGFCAVYRKPHEGGMPMEQRPITAHIEADEHHIECVVNFACSFLWASILDVSPPQPHLNLL